MNRYLRTSIWLVAIVLSVPACAPIAPQGVTNSGQADLPSEALTTDPAAYRLVVNDEVEVRLGERADLVQLLKVLPDGFIAIRDFPLVKAVGLTLEQLQHSVRSTVGTAMQVGNKAQAPKYVMAPGDDIEVRFTYYPNLNQLVRIRPDGKVTLPYVKSVMAEGQAPEALEQELQSRYRDYLKKPDLTVVVRTFGTYRVQVGSHFYQSGIQPGAVTVALKTFAIPQLFIAGEVARPGVIGYRPGMTLIQAIVESGGHKSTAEMRGVLVLRRNPDGEGVMIRRDIASDLKNGFKNDIALRPSDVVVIPKTQVATVAEAVDQYLYQVFAPLRNSSFGFVYNLTPDTTVQVK